MKNKISMMLALSALIYADNNQTKTIDQKSYFVGIGVAIQRANILQNGVGNTTNNKSMLNVYTPNASLAFGYRYYYARVYARVGQYHYKQDAIKYSIDGKFFEMNVDYSPIYYVAKNNEYKVKGIFGVGVGISHNTISNTYDEASILIKSLLESDPTQNYMEYGCQFGSLIETQMHLNFELLYRYRNGSLLQYYQSDTGDGSTYHLKSHEIYAGVSYSFSL